jgi:CheY-like chemotaxis protein
MGVTSNAVLDRGATAVDTPLQLLVVERPGEDPRPVLHSIRRGGFAVDAHLVGSRDELFAALGARDWDLVLYDYDIGGYGPRAVLGDLQSTGRDVPLLLIAATIAEPVNLDALEAGARDYVLRQDLASLPSVVARELGARAARRARDRAEQRLKLAERIALTGRIAGELAREINDLLAVVSGSVDLAARVVGAIARIQGPEASLAAERLAEAGGASLGEAARALCDAHEAVGCIRELVLEIRRGGGIAG